MGWTRNLYDLATVEEAIPFVTKQTKNPLRKLQLAFWVRELFVSEEYDKLREAMVAAWMSVAPPQAGGWEAYVRLCSDPLTEEAVLDFLGYLQFPVKCRLPATLAPPSAASAVFKPKAGETIPAIPTNWSESHRVVLWRAVRDALKHRNGERLYRLLGGLKPATVLAYLPEIADVGDIVTQYRKVGHGLQHVMAAAGLWVLEPVLAERAVWPRGEGRLFAIPRPIHACAPPMHAGPEGVVDEACKWWRHAVTEWGISLNNKGHLEFAGGDDAAEKFYAEYFVGDIPDEWSVAEREKSHRGLHVVQE
jgi:hypothetical protein